MNSKILFCYFAVIAAFLSGCTENSDIPDTVLKPDDNVKESFEARAKHEIEAKLSIPVTEKYTYEIHKSYINSDTIEDAVITVNRLAFAIDESIRTKKTARAAEMGYMGNFNFFLYYDGALDKFSVPIPVPSSPGRPLGVTFEPIISPTRNDIIIDYRIRNSGWRSYYTILNERDLKLIFQWKWFDHAGEDKPEALFHSLEPTPERVAKDIMIYESILDNANEVEKDSYAFVPKITKKGKLTYHFFYDPRVAKYKFANN